MSEQFKQNVKNHILTVLHDDVDFWPHGDSIFDDFFHSATLHEYTPHYLWCLEAIVWGIDEYDKFKSNVEADLID